MVHCFVTPLGVRYYFVSTSNCFHFGQIEQLLCLLARGTNSMEGAGKQWLMKSNLETLSRVEEVHFCFEFDIMLNI